MTIGDKNKSSRWFCTCRICKQKFVVNGIYHAIVPTHAGTCDITRAEMMARWAGLRDRRGYFYQPEMFIEAKRLNWKYRPDPTECDGRCMSARGPNCDCKCKGENHGCNHL